MKTLLVILLAVISKSSFGLWGDFIKSDTVVCKQILDDFVDLTFIGLTQPSLDTLKQKAREEHDIRKANKLYVKVYREVYNHVNSSFPLDTLNRAKKYKCFQSTVSKKCVDVMENAFKAMKATGPYWLRISKAYKRGDRDSAYELLSKTEDHIKPVETAFDQIDKYCSNKPLRDVLK